MGRRTKSVEHTFECKNEGWAGPAPAPKVVKVGVGSSRRQRTREERLVLGEVVGNSLLVDVRQSDIVLAAHTSPHEVYPK